MGKGDWKRPMNKKRFDESFERVFGKKELPRWNPEDDDDMIVEAYNPKTGGTVSIRSDDPRLRPQFILRGELNHDSEKIQVPNEQDGNVGKQNGSGTINSQPSDLRSSGEDEQDQS